MPATTRPKGAVAAVSAAPAAAAPPERPDDRSRILLLDASVWVSAMIAENRYHAEARELALATFRPAAALDLTFYESANALRFAGRTPSDTFALARIIRRRTAGEIARVDPNLIEFVARDAANHDLTAYDAAYVTVARLNGWTLVSADHRDLVSKGLAVAPDAAV